MVKALLCDIDGTLVDSNWLHASAWRDAFAAIGLDFDVETIRRQIGKGGSELIPVFVPWWKRTAVEQPLKDFRKFVFQRDYLPQVRVLPGAHDLLVRAKQARIEIALATSADADELGAYKRLVGMDDLVDQQTTASDTERAKPHPDIFTATLEKLGRPARECIALGDTPYDAEAAGLAGLRTIGVTTGGWTRDQLLEAGCVEVYASVAELLDRFDQSALMRDGLR